jgi:cytochrome P450
METYVAISLLEKTLQVSLAAPSALPWLGNLHQLNPKQLHAQLEAWGKALGPTYTFRLGRKRILVTSDVEIALSVLRDRPGRFRRLSTIEPVAEEMGINGVFSIEGEAWRRQRDLVMRALRLIPLTQVRLYVVGASSRPARAFAWIVSLDDVPIARGLFVSGEPQQCFE